MYLKNKMLLKRNVSFKEVVFLSILAVQAIVLSALDNQLHIPAGVPGMEIGLSNIITLVSLVFFSFYNTLLIVLIRCVSVTLFINGQVMFIFSLFGGILSTVIMWFMLRFARNLFSYVGIGIAGSIAHNLGQILAACLIISDLSLVSYLPVILTSGILTGSCIGICSTLIVKLLKKFNLFEYK